MRVQKTITLAANDLCTVMLNVDASPHLAIKNNGPGVCWLSFDPSVSAAVNNVDCFNLKTGETFATDQLIRGMNMTLNADTASTIVTLVVL